ENRLDAFSLEGASRSVRTAFASAYHSLIPAAAELFRLLGLHPGPTVSAHLGAAIVGAPLARTRALLAELVGPPPITAPGGDRYRFHDLIRLYAYECAQHEELPDRRADCLIRILDWYLAIGEAANRILQPSRNRVVPSLRYRPAQLPFHTGN